MRKFNGKKSNVFLFGIVFCGIILSLIFVIATGTTPVWVGSSVNYTAVEDNIYLHNLTLNITGYNNDITFEIISTNDNKIYFTNSSGRNTVQLTYISPYISISDSISGELKINATYNNQTGFYEVPILATNGTEGSITGFEFIINATNDIPQFVGLNANYSFPPNEGTNQFINATDEEVHYPLDFDISFVNCTHASWLGIADNISCDLFNLSEINNVSALMNYTYDANDVGGYWANVTVTDYNSGCPHVYCDASTYEVNKTNSSLVYIEVFASLSVDVSNCTNKIFQMGELGWCNITVRTQGQTDSITSNGTADFARYTATPSNTTWFQKGNITTSSNYFSNLNVSFNASRKFVGSWTINFTVNDTTYNQINYTIFNVSVNRTNNYAPSIFSLSNVTGSVEQVK